MSVSCQIVFSTDAIALFKCEVQWVESPREQLTSVCGDHRRREDHLPVLGAVTECVSARPVRLRTRWSEDVGRPYCKEVGLVLRQLLNNKQNSPIRTRSEKKKHMAACSRATIAQALPNPAQCVLLNAATRIV